MDAKILSRDQLLAFREDARRRGRSVVHCHGCFDIVHPGHIRHLRYAKALGDVLLVSITGDAEMKKGTGRPLIPEELRAENLAALDCVDWVYVESRPTAAELLAEVRPDVYVKGREYESNKDPRFQAERQAVEAGGGRVVFSSGDVVFSSTALISAIETSIDPFHARLSQLAAEPSLQGPELFSLISAFRGKRLLVVGETILDTYVFCDRPEVAGESPVMTLRPLERRHYDGGAAIIARHAAAMGARPVLVTAMPTDAQGEAVRRRLVAEGVEVRPLAVDRPLCEKQRFLVGTQKVVKLDLVERLVLDAAQQDRLVELAGDAARESGCHAAVIADFGQGMFSPVVLRRLCRVLRPLVAVLAGDVSGRRSHLRSMGEMDLLCPSESELREAFALTDRALPAVAWELLEETRSRAALVTMGSEGAIAFDRLPDADAAKEDRFRTRLRAEHVPALAPIAIDPLGCGDALITGATLALAAGGSLLAGAFIGSVAAAVQAQRLGNLPVSATDIRHGITRVHSAHLTFAAADVVAARRGEPALRAS
ncbi:MAG: adenylyltransferase/cytidyltransferase family protein [Phycisphaerae bacterium]|nr:adenylyltransferase/cytidyltransferase family protein [Phycisphaerae bacterium]